MLHWRTKEEIFIVPWQGESSIGFWRCRMIIRINVLLHCVHRPRIHKTWISLRFGDCLCPRPQVYKIRGGERLQTFTPTTWVHSCLDCTVLIEPTLASDRSESTTQDWFKVSECIPWTYRASVQPAFFLTRRKAAGSRFHFTMRPNVLRIISLRCTPCRHMGYVGLEVFTAGSYKD
jgi:hypothetical protein